MQKLAAIDLGNTFAKVACFVDGALVSVSERLDDQAVVAAIARFAPSAVMLGSVGSRGAAIRALLQPLTQVYELDYRTPTPLTNAYLTPQTLGVDRIAAASMMAHESPDQDHLIVDLGTCVTFDVVGKGGRYLGGAIAPGLQMRLRAMHQQTARLPLVSPEGENPLIGASTEQCLRSGAVFGIVFEIAGWHTRLKADGLTNVNLVLTGGDSAFFEPKIKAPFFARPKLVLEGLHCILSTYVL